MAASRRRGSPLMRLLTLLMLLLTITAVCSNASEDSENTSDSEDATLDPSLPTSPPVVPMPVMTSSSATEVVVHVAEQFLPFASRTIVGPLTSASAINDGNDDDDGTKAYHVMFSFSAYAFSIANAQVMDCFLISDNGTTWLKTVPDGSSSFDGQGFCARRDIISDSSSYGVAVFRKRHDRATLIHASRDSTAAVIANAEMRGWIEPPIVTFRVTRLQKWHVAPVLRLVASVTAISVAESSTDKVNITSLCPSDPRGRALRVLEGGNFYGNATGMPHTVLCVSYVQRSLHDLNDEEQFFAHVKLVPVSGWRFNVCPWYWKEIMDVVAHKMVLVEAANKDATLICYQDSALVGDEDDPTDLEDTRDLLKRIFINETEPDIDKRVVIEYHEEDAWAFAPEDDNLNSVNNF
jgi:hypothetical protein